MSEHTKEPWNVDQRALLRVRTANDITICSCGTADTIRDQWEANARRIVACVNACIGYPTEQLEELGRFISSGEAQAMAEHHKQIEQQRDELLKDMEEVFRIAKMNQSTWGGWMRDHAQKAIAKVKP